MSRLEPSDRIEQIVGKERHEFMHLGRAVSDEQRVYILHSHECVNSGRDLRLCQYSLALDKGIDPDEWVEDVPVLLTCKEDRLRPIRTSDLLSPPGE